MKCVRMARWSQHVLVSATAILALALGAGAAGAADLPMEKVVPLSLATEAAQGALAACEGKGFHISVAVTDQSGLVRILLRDDKAGPHTLDSSMKKAYTATSLGLSTGVLTKIVVEHPDAVGLKDMNEKVLIMQGGLPIKVGAEVIGGIGVGGTPGGETDEACTRAGLDKIMDRLR
ncbi:MAG: heme-binding protein [Candidatus Methylomirabilales bacterium]